MAGVFAQIFRQFVPTTIEFDDAKFICSAHSAIAKTQAGLLNTFSLAGFMMLQKIVTTSIETLLSPLALFSVASAIVVTTATGPFGTYEGMPLVSRTLYWGAVVIFSTIVAVLVKKTVFTLLKDLGFFRQALVMSLGMAGIFTPILVTLNIAAIGNIAMPIGTLAFIVFAVSMVIRYINYFWEMTDPPKPRFVQRLGVDATKIGHVTVDDHYVLVKTPEKAHRVLMRFGDAIDELSELNGMQVHRSHWVADHMVSILDRSSGRPVLVLNCGTLVPVSRGYQDAVETRHAIKLRVA